MAPAPLILTILLKVFQLRPDTDTTLIVRNATGEYGFTAVQCTSSTVGLDGALKMEVIEPLPNSTYKVHLRYQSFMGEVLYLKVDNMTNKVFLDKERSAVPPFKAIAAPLSKDEDERVFVLATSNSDNLQMKIKKTDSQMLTCSSQEEDASSADAVRYIDSQELFMIPRDGGINSHRHVVGVLLEC